MKKNILHIISSLNWRGGEQQVDYILNHQSKEFEYYLFCPTSAELINRNQHNKDKIFTYKKRFGFDIFGALELKKVCKENKIELIHLHDSHAINTYILADLYGMKLPAVIHRHVNFSLSSKWKYNSKKIKKIICVNEKIKNNLSTFIDPKKIVVIHPGIDLKRFNSEKRNSLKQELNLPDETKIIGIVSALEKEKNIGEFIEIANLMLGKNIKYHFVIIGDGSLKSELQNQHPNIHFLGFRNDVQSILPSLDVFLFTSTNEGFPLVLLEAMESKVPIVSGNFLSVNEIIQHEKTGYIYTSISDAEEKIKILLSTEDIKNKLTQNAFSFVQQFDVTLMCKEIEKVYNELLNNPS